MIINKDKLKLCLGIISGRYKQHILNKADYKLLGYNMSFLWTPPTWDHVQLKAETIIIEAILGLNKPDPPNYRSDY